MRKGIRLHTSEGWSARPPHPSSPWVTQRNPAPSFMGCRLPEHPKLKAAVLSRGTGKELSRFCRSGDKRRSTVAPVSLSSPSSP